MNQLRGNLFVKSQYDFYWFENIQQENIEYSGDNIGNNDTPIAESIHGENDGETIVDKSRCRLRYKKLSIITSEEVGSWKLEGGIWKMEE